MSLLLVGGYICSGCQQKLSEKYKISGEFQQFIEWEIPLELSDDDLSNTTMASHNIGPIVEDSNTSKSSISEHNTLYNVWATNDNNEERNYFSLDSTKDVAYMDIESQHEPMRHTHDVPVTSTEYNDEEDVNRSGEYYNLSRGLANVSDPGLKGLQNLGNTCYMNSALQCLLHIPQLKHLFRSSNYKKSLKRNNPLGSGGKVAETFADLMQSMWSTDSNASMSPEAFKIAIGKFNRIFAGYDQQDPFQLLNSVLDVLHEDLKTDERSDSSPISELFHGYTVSVNRCLNCNHEHLSGPELFSSLSLNIPNKQPYTLEQCFIDMSAIHYQTDDSKWYCSHCSKLSKSTTKTVISKLPHILIIHFKRFNYDPKSYVHIDTFIEYPLTFEMNNKEYAPRLPPAKYELIGICLKQGSLRGGHAYAYAKHENESWYNFNDSSVRSIDPKQVISKHAYVLIYRRLDNTELKTDSHRSHGQSKTKTDVGSNRQILHSTDSSWKACSYRYNS